ncbi:MAG: EI24 domain-containing protein [Leptospiraceae bacterium]|nr:EI24 domain-containing protein [Leptospiraceae bacterium]
MFERIGRGIGMPLNSFGYISKHNLWGYMVLPLIVTAVLVGIIAFVLWVYVLGVISNALNFDVSTWPWILKILFSAFTFIVKILVFYLLFSLIMRIYLALFDIIVIPFLSPMVEKILQSEGITTIQIKGSEMVGYILATVWYSIKMLIWQAFIALLLFFTGPLQPFLNFGFSSYFLGRTYFDTVFDLLGRPKEFSNMIKGFRSEATGLGIFSSLFVLIPLIGAIFAPILCVVASTRLYAEKYNKAA